jgi:hypothetical protein
MFLHRNSVKMSREIPPLNKFGYGLFWPKQALLGSVTFYFYSFIFFFYFLGIGGGGGWWADVVP